MSEPDKICHRLGSIAVDPSKRSSAGLVYRQSTISCGSVEPGALLDFRLAYPYAFLGSMLCA
jgi:hypothetical protein